MLVTIVFVFILGYLIITLEHLINVNKAATALLTGVLCWVAYAFSGIGSELLESALASHFSEIAGILFFLLGAMTIVELIDAHDGFEIIAHGVNATTKWKLLWLVCFITFFLSAILDNLTTTIVMITILRKLISESEDRLLFVGMVVIASNAGGCWSPIGDVTTTMLWIGGQITAWNIIMKLFLPGLICLLVPLAFISVRLKGNIAMLIKKSTEVPSNTSFERNLFFFSGIGILFFVPVFKTLTHLPPYMGMLFGLGLLWLLSEIVHKDKDEMQKDAFSVLHALKKIDMPSIMFFLGILLSISALQSVGALSILSTWMSQQLGDINFIALGLGLLSAVVDNVPLVAATMGMYDLQTFPTDHYFWELLAYTTGTGGSVLIIGSAAGVAAMGMEKISFFWYLKRISLLAFLGYIAGALFYVLQHQWLGI